MHVVIRRYGYNLMLLMLLNVDDAVFGRTTWESQPIDPGQKAGTSHDRAVAH